MPLNKTTLSGSISVLGDIELTGSLLGTASWALNAVSASHTLLADGLNATSLTLEDLIITNTASIEYLNVIYQSSSVIYSSGSNIFGDASDDTQTLHGQVEVINDIHVGGILEVDGGISGNLTGSVQGNADTATSASHALVADYAINAPDLQSVVTTGNYVSSSINFSNSDLGISVKFGGDLFGDPAIWMNQNNYMVAGNGSQIGGVTFALGTVTATEITGSLNGNADTATSASHALLADGLNATSLTLADLVITNTASIQYLDVVYQSSSIIYSSGSNIFGDASDDTQTLHGQVEILNDAHVYGDLTVDGNIFGTASWSNRALTASYAAAIADIVYGREIHVSWESGDDATGNGALNKPYKTINAAVTASAAGGGDIIVIHRGIYAENVTVTKGNLSFIGANTAGSGLVEVNGTFTVNIASAAPSIRLDGMRIQNLVHQGSGSLYGWEINVINSYLKSGPSAYSDFIDSEFQCLSGVQITGPGTVVFQAGKQAGVVVNNPNAAVVVKDSVSAFALSALAGTLSIQNSVVLPPSSGSAAITSAAGTVVQISNSTISTLTGLPERISIGGFLAYDDVQFNKALSTLGTSLNTKAYFQSAEVLGLSATGSLFGTASWANNATSASFATLANGLNPGSSISVVNITGSGNIQTDGNIQIGGKLNFLNLPNYTNDVDAAAGGIEVGDIYRNGNFVVIRIS